MEEGEKDLTGAPEMTSLAEALQVMKADTSNLLKDMLRGISMWGASAATALLLAVAWLALAQAILTYAHPYGSPPVVLETLYAGYAFSAISAVLGVVLLWRYLLLRKRYSRLFRIASNLR